MTISFQILQQVEGGDLIVNRGNEVKPKEGSTVVRNLNAVDGYEAAVKLAQVCRHFMISHT